MPIAEGDKALLEKIRKEYRADRDYWKPIQDEADTDMQYVTGDPWSARDKRERSDANRPALASDELQQYLNQAINQLRQNKRGIKIVPLGDGSNDKTATLLQDIIRSIEYNSNAQQNAYIPASQNQIERSYGFFRMGRRFIGETARQEIELKGIVNPNAVLFDRHVKEADWSDAEHVFVLNPLPTAEYERRYPEASVIGFSPNDEDMTSDWVREDMVLVAEYWVIERTKRSKLFLKDGSELFEDETDEEIPEENVELRRKVEQKKVTQYITNGIEILEKKPQPGTIIPIFAVIGKEMWVPEGGKTERKIFSMIRLARPAYMLYCYTLTLQAEELSQIPKSKIVGAVGQFKTDADAWDTSAKLPHAYLQYDPITDATGQQTLPPPQFWQYRPNSDAFEVVLESCKRRIQAALGITPLPTAAQRRNEKSGVALDKIQQQEAIGSFHFTDNADRARALCGRAMLEWIPEVYSDEREMQVPQEDGTTRRIRLNTDEPYEGENGEMEHHKVNADLAHMVTISTGPSYESQREAANDFVDTLMSNIEALPIDPPSKAKLLSIAVKLKDLGPLGDAMAEIISPDDPNGPQQAQQAFAQAQQQAQQLHAYSQQLEAEIQKLNAEKQGKVIDNEYRLKIEETKSAVEKYKIDADNAVKVALAEIQTNSQNLRERAKWEHEVWAETHGAAHDVALQADQQGHQQDMAQQQAANAQQTQASDQEHQAQMAEQAQSSQQGEAE